eukprot:CAMPEP_0172499014 /NCGR_PEP_ID=MMETSP1066-20121228/121063_1 /TAXON_ID=671091 /ORGANISM="Coscinodiscus wailesii, Strain CCMP2513" /LENGTH=248 /DNA_ID=CAMNT_0013272543 /DNA_START=57 /DNA_END=803 /DNA_ORIENTATION=+
MIKSSVLFTLVTTVFAASAEECSTVELAGFLAGYAGFANAVEACSAGSGGVSQLIDPGVIITDQMCGTKECVDLLPAMKEAAYLMPTCTVAVPLSAVAEPVNEEIVKAWDENCNVTSTRRLSSQECTDGDLSGVMNATGDLSGNITACETAVNATNATGIMDIVTGGEACGVAECHNVVELMSERLKSVPDCHVKLNPKEFVKEIYDETVAEWEKVCGITGGVGTTSISSVLAFLTVSFTFMVTWSLA